MEIKIHLYDAGHMTKMATMSVYGKNKNIKMSSFKSSENIQNKEGGPEKSVSDKTLQKSSPREPAD